MQATKLNKPKKSEKPEHPDVVKHRLLGQYSKLVIDALGCSQMEIRNKQESVKWKILRTILQHDQYIIDIVTTIINKYSYNYIGMLINLIIEPAIDLLPEENTTIEDIMEEFENSVGGYNNLTTPSIQIMISLITTQEFKNYLRTFIYRQKLEFFTDPEACSKVYKLINVQQAQQEQLQQAQQEQLQQQDALIDKYLDPISYEPSTLQPLLLFLIVYIIISVYIIL